MSVRQNDLGKAIASELITGLLQEFPLQLGAVRYRPGLVFCLEDLSEEVLWKDNAILALRRTQDGLSHGEKVRSEWQVRAVFFENADGDNTDASGFRHRSREFRGAQLFVLY